MTAYDKLFEVVGGDIDHVVVYQVGADWQAIEPKQISREALKEMDLLDTPIIGFDDTFTYVTVVYDAYCAWIEAIPHRPRLGRRYMKSIEAG